MGGVLNNWQADISSRMAASRIVDRARTAREEDYREAVRLYLDRIPLNRVKAVYQLGSVGAPGLSDVDLFLVLKDVGRDYPSRYSIRQLGGSERYLFSHECEKMDEQSFRVLSYWFPCFEIQHIWGNKLYTEEVDNGEEDLALLFLAKFLTVKLPAELLLYACMKDRFHERVVAAMVNSTRKAFALWERSGMEIWSEADMEMKRFATMRKEWFHMKEGERLEELKRNVVSATALCLELAGSTAGEIRRRWLGGSGIRGSGRMDIKGVNRSILFSDSWSPEEAMGPVVGSAGRTWPVPAEFSLIPLAFRSSEGPVGRHVRSIWSGEENVRIQNDNAEKMLGRHVEAVEALALFHACAFRMPAHGYHTFWAPYTNNKLALLRDRTFNRIAGMSCKARRR